MLVRLVGVHRVSAKLANGDTRTYYYAWRGGPRIKAVPGSHAFGAEYHRLTRHRPDPIRAGMLPELVHAYVASPAFTGLKASTRKGYEAMLDLIEAEYHSLPLAMIGKLGARSMFMDWRDSFAGTPRKADLLMAVLARLLSFALDRELIERNPLERIGKLSEGSRRDAVWSDEQIAAFVAVASPELRLAMEIARWTGQRQGDLIRLTWTAYNGTHISLKQGKTGARARIRVYSELKTLLDSTPRRAVTILTNTRGRPWTGDGLRASWAAACDRAGVEGVTFHDLRGTFVTLAYRHHGASFRDIAEITGHSERDAEAIIRKHYLAGDAAIELLETGNETARDV
jgi:integrase